MPTITDSPGTKPPSITKPLWQRLLWFVGLWAGSVLALGVVGYAIKLVLKP